MGDLSVLDPHSIACVLARLGDPKDVVSCARASKLLRAACHDHCVWLDYDLRPSDEADSERLSSCPYLMAAGSLTLRDVTLGVVRPLFAAGPRRAIATFRVDPSSDGRRTPSDVDPTALEMIAAGCPSVTRATVRGVTLQGITRVLSAFSSDRGFAVRDVVASTFAGIPPCTAPTDLLCAIAGLSHVRDLTISGVCVDDSLVSAVGSLGHLRRLSLVRIGTVTAPLSTLGRLACRHTLESIAVESGSTVERHELGLGLTNSEELFRAMPQLVSITYCEGADSFPDLEFFYRRSNSGVDQECLCRVPLQSGEMAALMKHIPPINWLKLGNWKGESVLGDLAEVARSESASSLQGLTLFQKDIPFGDELWNTLSCFRHLRCLSLRSPFSSAGLPTNLEKVLQSIESLEIGTVDDAMCAAVAKLPNLAWLKVLSSRNGLSDAVVDPLLSSKSLVGVRFNGGMAIEMTKGALRLQDDMERRQHDRSTGSALPTVIPQSLRA